MEWPRTPSFSMTWGMEMRSTGNIKTWGMEMRSTGDSKTRGVRRTGDSMTWRRVFQILDCDNPLLIVQRVRLYGMFITIRILDPDICIGTFVTLDTTIPPGFER
jgi:hypothetical protein